MSAFGSSISRFPTSRLTGYGGSLKKRNFSKRTLTTSEQKTVRGKLRAAAYTHKGVDWHRLFLYYDTDNSGEIGFLEFKRMLRSDAKISVSMLSDVDVKALYHSVDVDGSGEIDADEFIAWVEDTGEDKGGNEAEAQDEKGRETSQRKWGASHSYGKVSPRKLHSPSQRAWTKKGWTTNNDENSKAEGAILRREGSVAALASMHLNDSDSTTATTSRSLSEQRQAETAEQQLIKVRDHFLRLKADYAEQSKVLSEALDTIKTLQTKEQENAAKMKEHRRTIAMLNRNGSSRR